MARFNYTLFFDFHTSTIIPDVGEHFDVEQFTDDLVSCKIDFITWHARCNQGNAYYNTEYGYRHPSLKYDLFGKICESCHRKGIRISAYLNGGLSDQELLMHRDWMRIAPDGHTMTEARPSAELRAVCYNSPYREHLKNMARELAQNYHVDGFFFDCMGSYYTCICPVCMQEMKEKGIDYNNPEEIEKFTEFSIRRLSRELYDTVRAVNPDSFFFVNGCRAGEIHQLDTQLECECLPPCKELGYDYLPVFAHYLRTIAGGNSVLCMTGRFYQWADFGGLRKPESLEYDFFYGIANGMRPELSDHYHPRGDRYPAVTDLTRTVYRTLQQYDEWCLDAENRGDIAVVYPMKESNLELDIPMKAAVRMLTELKLQFDVVSQKSDWSRYRMLIFPDNSVFDDETVRRVNLHLQKGGFVIATGFAGLDSTGTRFAIDGWPAVYRGRTPFNPVYFAPEGPFAEDLPQLPLSVYASAAQVQAAPGADISMWTVKPYHNREWDGIHSNWYTPPQEKTTDPFIAFKGNIAYCAGEIITGYYHRSPYQSRLLLRNLIRHFLPNPKFRSSTLPSFARAFVQYKDNLELLHVICYNPELRGEAVALEERGTLVNSELSLRTDCAPFKRVYTAPDRKELPFTIKDGYCTVTLPLLQGYALLVFEK